MTKGFDLIAKMTGLQTAVEDYDVVITGEGRIDSQTGYGKVVASVASMLKINKDKRLIGVAGRVDGPAEDIRKQYGMEQLVAIRDYASGDEDSIRNAESYLKIIGSKLAHHLKDAKYLSATS